MALHEWSARLNWCRCDGGIGPPFPGGDTPIGYRFAFTRRCKYPLKGAALWQAGCRYLHLKN